MTIGLIGEAVPSKCCEAGSVVGNSAHSGFIRIPERTPDLRRLNVIIDRAVEIHALPFAENHDSSRSDSLAHRGKVIHRVLSGGNVVFAIGKAKALLPDDLSPAYHGDRDRRNRSCGQLLLN